MNCKINHTVNFLLFEEMFGKQVQLDDRFESVHIWSRKLALINMGRFVPILLKN